MQNVGTLHSYSKSDPDEFWQTWKRTGNTEQTATGNRTRGARKGVTLSGTAVTYVLKVCCCVGHTKREVRRLHNLSGGALER